MSVKILSRASRWSWLVLGWACIELGMSLSVQAQTDAEWWPSEWGPEDERGASNRITADRIVQAARLITEGRIYSLGRVYEPGMPSFGNRHFSLTLPGKPTGGPMGANQVVYNDELFSGEIGQIGTQFDGLGHIGTRVGEEDIFYNGFRLNDIHTSYGLTRLGIENAGPFFARGVLIDVAAYKGVERLAGDYIISIADIEGALQSQGSTIREGDVVLFHTGHGALWMVDNETYARSNPGPGITAIRWLVERKIVMAGADTGNVEANPGEDPERPFQGHQWLMNRHGVYNFENLDLSELAADRVYEFAFVFTPLLMRGATGSPGNPLAIK